MNRPDEITGIILIVGIAALIGVLVLYVFYLLTLSKALSRVSPHNRSMEPGQVWLMFVPCVNLVWGFLIAVRVPESLKKEFQERGQDDGSDYGKTLGLTVCILNIGASVVGNLLDRAQPDSQLVASGLSLLMNLVAFICFVMFWVKIANYSKMLELDNETRRLDFDRRLDRFDDDDDDGYVPKPAPPLPQSDAIKEGEPGQRGSSGHQPPDEGIKPAPQ